MDIPSLPFLPIPGFSGFKGILVAHNVTLEDNLKHPMIYLPSFPYRGFLKGLMASLGTEWIKNQPDRI
jgi:hypothetical protein